MAKDEDLEKGDEVTWDYPGNEVAGKVVKQITAVRARRAVAAKG